MSLSRIILPILLLVNAPAGSAQKREATAHIPASSSGAQKLSKEQAKKIADLVLARDYNLITRVTYNKESGVWTCSPTRGIVHGDMDIEIRNLDLHYRITIPHVKPEKNPFRLEPPLKKAILDIASPNKSG